LEITREELAKHNGKDKDKIYVAAHGRVYDVTKSKLWKNGKHMNRHKAGTDLTESLEAAPHGAEVLQRFEQVGELKSGDEKIKLPVPGFIQNFVEKYPFFKRHPHPMVVHFPMTFYITCSIFLLWYHLLNPDVSFLHAILYLHVLGTISLPLALLTGWFSWKVNYLGKPMGHIKWKIFLSTLVLAFDIIVLTAMINDVNVLASPQGWQIFLLVIVFSYLPIVSLIGYHGGQLVY
jgi:predicted heme/steroid binding protein/uncharacterized membrane protein